MSEWWENLPGSTEPGRKIPDEYRIHNKVQVFNPADDKVANADWIMRLFDKWLSGDFEGNRVFTLQEFTTEERDSSFSGLTEGSTKRVIFNTTLHVVQVWNGKDWVTL